MKQTEVRALKAYLEANGFDASRENIMQLVNDMRTNLAVWQDYRSDDEILFEGVFHTSNQEILKVSYFEACYDQSTSSWHFGIDEAVASKLKDKHNDRTTVSYTIDGKTFKGRTDTWYETVIFDDVVSYSTPSKRFGGYKDNQDILTKNSLKNNARAGNSAFKRQHKR
jgi:hypothetical protein